MTVAHIGGQTRQVTAGDLTEIISILAPSNTADGSGGAVAGWTQWAGAYRACVTGDDRTTQELAINGGERAVSAMNFIVRRQVAEAIRDGYGVSCRIRWGGRDYAITSIGAITRADEFVYIHATHGLTA